jgi:methionyl-tRNA formyltransferase
VNPRTDGLHQAASVIAAPRAAGERVRTVFIGSGAFGEPSLRRLAEHPDIELVGVVTAPARPVGRRQVLTPTPIETTARELGLDPVLTPERLRAPESIVGMLAYEPSLAVLVDYGQIVPPAILGLPHGALNVHPSLLPRHRGATPIPAAILAGDIETGVSVIRMDEGIDTGPILAQVAVSLDGTETTPELERGLAVDGAELLIRTLGPWLRGEAAAEPQDDARATLTRPLRREDGRLRASKPAADLERQVRAFRGWPGSFVETPAGRLIVHEATVDADAPGPFSTIDEVGLNTIEGRLAFRTVQPAGGRVMPWSDYLHGGAKLVGGSIVE